MEKTKQITISARMVDHSMAGIKHAGTDLGQLLRKSGISQGILKDPKARIPMEQVVMLHRYATISLNDEAHGMLEKPVKTGFFRFIATSVLHCRTIGSALQRMSEFYSLFENSFLCDLRTEGNQAEFVATRIPGHKVVDNYAIDSMLMENHRFVGWLCNERIILNQVNLDFASPDYRNEYQHMFYGAPVLLNQEHNSISFDRSYLERPIVQNEASLSSYIRRAPMDIYIPLSAGGHYTLNVRKEIKEAMSQHIGVPTLQHVSNAMGLNSQTLRRRLREEGTSFHGIKAQIRRDIGIHHLSNPDISVERVAEFTGYAEPSAFIRAFKGWTGFTPLQFRKGLDVD